MPAPKNCPKHGHPMKEIQYEGETLDRCDVCGGTWLDANEFMAVLQKRDQKFSEKERLNVKEWEELPTIELDGPPRDTSLKCPICQKKMAREKFSAKHDLLIDRCAAGHGVWLDATELERAQMIFEGLI